FGSSGKPLYVIVIVLHVRIPLLAFASACAADAAMPSSASASTEASASRRARLRRGAPPAGCGCADTSICRPPHALLVPGCCAYPTSMPRQKRANLHISASGASLHHAHQRV